jgi:hypothetical protein
MNVENMLALSYFLDRLDPENFDLSTWASSGNNTLSIGDFVSSKVTDNSCGTSACIAGWAVYLYALDVRKQLELPDIEYYDEDGKIDTEYDLHNKNNLISFKYQSFAERWLGLNYSEASSIFYCDEDSLWDIHSKDYDLDRIEHIEGSPIDISSIHPKHAADLLRRLALGEISFPERL